MVERTHSSLPTCKDLALIDIDARPSLAASAAAKERGSPERVQGCGRKAKRALRDVTEGRRGLAAPIGCAQDWTCGYLLSTVDIERKAQGKMNWDSTDVAVSACTPLYT